MLAICKYLLDTVPELSILLISGSPVVHSFRMPVGLDYIKLPCLGRNESNELSAKYLGTQTHEITRLRADLIRSAVANFQPHLILVDKKPYGLEGELKPALTYLKTHSPETKLVLLLRDILDAPEITRGEWSKNGYYEALQWYYDQILVVGMPEIFNLTQEYQFPASAAEKVKFCGYIRRDYGCKVPELIHQELEIKANEKLVLVTPGGGADGYRLVETYLKGLGENTYRANIKSLIISGPEMPPAQRQKIAQISQQLAQVQVSEFTDDMASYMNAADAIVSMGGYNTICEILSLSKRAVVIPRINPVQEQWIRAERMADFGLFRAIHPEKLTPQHLMGTVLEQLDSPQHHLPPVERLDLNALPRISHYLSSLVYGDASSLSQRQWNLSEMVYVPQFEAVI
jgi:predicted glycosyltransferase